LSFIFIYSISFSAERLTEYIKLLLVSTALLVWRRITRWTKGPCHSSCCLEYKLFSTMERCGKLEEEEKKESYGNKKNFNA